MPSKIAERCFCTDFASLIMFVRKQRKTRAKTNGDKLDKKTPEEVSTSESDSSPVSSPDAGTTARVRNYISHRNSSGAKLISNQRAISVDTSSVSEINRRHSKFGSSMRRGSSPPYSYHGVPSENSSRCASTSTPSSHRAKHQKSPVQDVGVATEANASYRNYMEDACVVISSFSGLSDQLFIGLYDGHGGDWCATYSAKYLHSRYLQSVKQMASDPLSAESQDECLSAFSDAYAAIDEELAEFGRAKGLPLDAGTTALNCIVKKVGSDLVILTANAGDTRAVLGTAGQAVRLTRDHLPTDEDEHTRITLAGGVVFRNRVGGVLAVSRALGHPADKPLVTGDPYLRKHIVAPQDEFIILATDGLWNVFSDEAASEFVRNRLAVGMTARQVSRCLINEALARKSRDNITVVVVNLQQNN